MSLLNELNGLVLQLPKKQAVDLKGLFSRDDLCGGVSLYQICSTKDMYECVCVCVCVCEHTNSY